MEYLRNELGHNGGVAVMYCDHKEREIQSPVNLMAGLWRQLVRGRSITSAVKELYIRHREPGTRPSLDEVMGVLRSEINGYTMSKVFLIIDALDECPQGENIQQTLLTALQEVQPTIHLMFTSRPHVNIATKFPKIIPLDIRTNNDDMESYIVARMAKDHDLPDLLEGHADLQEDIKRTIVNNSSGMYVL